MKIKYANFILEQLDFQKFKQEYDTVRDNLEDFWGLLQDKIEEFSETNSRDMKEVSVYNQKIRDDRNNKPNIVPPVNAIVPTIPAPSAITASNIRPFSKDDTATLLKKLRNPKFKNQYKEIKALIDERNKKSMKTQNMIKKSK